MAVRKSACAKLDSFVILIFWIEVCTSESAYIMLQVIIGKNQSFTWILLIQFQGKLIAQLLAKGHLQHASWVLGTVAPWPSLRLYMLMLVPIGTCPQSFCRGFVWHLSYWATKDSGYQKLTKYGSCLCILCHLILLLQFKICTVLNSKLGIRCSSPASTNQVNCAN